MSAPSAFRTIPRMGQDNRRQDGNYNGGFPAYLDHIENIENIEANMGSHFVFTRG